MLPPRHRLSLSLVCAGFGRAFWGWMDDGDGEDVTVNAFFSSVINILTLSITAYAIYRVVAYLGPLTDQNMDNITKGRLFGVAAMCGAIGGSWKFMIEISRPAQSGPLYWPTIGTALYLIPIGAILGILVWGLIFSGILVKYVGSAGEGIKGNIYGIVAMSILAGLYSDRILSVKFPSSDESRQRLASNVKDRRSTGDQGTTGGTRSSRGCVHGQVCLGRRAVTEFP
jgi:hypothetical protein